MEHLNDGETMTLSLRPHKLFLAPSVFALTVSVVVVGVWSKAGLETAVNGASKVTVVAILVAAAAWFGWSLLDWHFTRFHLTSDRVLVRSGVLSRRRAEIPLNRVNTVFVHQTIFERMVRCGRLSIESAGESGQETFPQCPRPMDVKDAIHRQKSVAPAATGTQGGAPTDLDLASQLERIAALRDQGVLDEWEFDDAKSRVISKYSAS